MKSYCWFRSCNNILLLTHKFLSHCCLCIIIIYMVQKCRGPVIWETDSAGLKQYHFIPQLTSQQLFSLLSPQFDLIRNETPCFTSHAVFPNFMYTEVIAYTLKVNLPKCSWMTYTAILEHIEEVMHWIKFTEDYLKKLKLNCQQCNYFI